jgi:hypothetical protein
MSSNTEILIKRSLSTDTPASLLQGELAYSYSSNTLFIGTPGGTASLRIGGYRDFSSNYSSGAGQYGNTTTIPVITVGANGLITAISTAAISTELDINADSGGPSAVNLLTQTLNIAGGDGLTSSVSGQTITLNVDNTLVRANTPITTQYIDSSVQISGNLIVLGTETIINVDTLRVDDPLLQLAANNTSDVVDIGFFGHYNDGVQRHTGLFRHAADKLYYLFSNYSIEPSANVITPFADEFALATLRSNLTANTANVLNTLTLQSGSQLYANGNAYFHNAPIFNDGANVQGTIVLTSGNVIQFDNIDDTAIASIYDDGSTNQSNLNIDANTISLNANTTVTGNVSVTGKVIAGQSTGTGTGGFTFGGTETSRDSGMFSPADGEVHFYANNTDVAEFTSSTFKIKQATYLTGLANTQTANIIYFDATTGQLSYGRANDINPDEIANGAFRMSISSIDGLVTTNGSGIQLANGAIIKDTSGDAVAFGQNAGTLNQGLQAVAIGDSAGYNAQGAYGVAIGYGAGNINQGQTAVAIGINAGISNQGAYGIAIGNSSGSAQGQYSIALGYDSGGSQGVSSIAIGTQAGKGNTSAIGVNTIAIGNKAGFESGFANSIILNASGENFVSLASGFYVNPIRYTAAQDANTDGIMFYNSSTKEIRYSYALDGGSF